MIIYLTRHGQTTGDLEDRYGGDYDDHLTDEGQQQSAHLAEQLNGKGIVKLYASPKIRAQETATIISSRLNLPVVTLEAFRERNGYGVLTGLIKAEAKQKYPEQVEILKDVHASVDGAEQYEPFRTRITDALARISSEKSHTVAVVTHGGPLRLIFRDILHIGEIEVSDCAYAVLETQDGGYRLVESSGIVIKS